MFKNSIVRTPGKSYINGLTSAGLGLPNYDLALKQHQDYIEALTSCGVNVKVLPPDENFPDSTFVGKEILILPKLMRATRGCDMS